MMELLGFLFACVQLLFSIGLFVGVGYVLRMLVEEEQKKKGKKE